LTDESGLLLPVVLAQASGSGGDFNAWRPGHVEITKFSIGQEKRKLPDGNLCVAAYLMLHSWTHLDPVAAAPPLEDVLCRQYRVLAKTAVLLPSDGSFFVRLLRQPELDREDEWRRPELSDAFGTDVLTVRLADVTLHPWIRPLESSFHFYYPAPEELFELDRHGTELLQRHSRPADKAQRPTVVKLGKGMRCRVVEEAREEEEEEEEGERWDDLEDETVASMPENEDVNIRCV
jgi:hypothetical protein